LETRPTTRFETYQSQIDHRRRSCWILVLAVWHSAPNTFPNNSLIAYKSQVAMLCESNKKTESQLFDRPAIQIKRE